MAHPASIKYVALTSCFTYSIFTYQKNLLDQYERRQSNSLPDWQLAQESLDGQCLINYIQLSAIWGLNFKTESRHDIVASDHNALYHALLKQHGKDIIKNQQFWNKIVFEFRASYGGNINKPT